MGQRNIRSTNQMFNLEHDQQGQFRIHPEPCVLSGTLSNYPQPSMNHVLPVAEPITAFVPPVGTSENLIPYGIATQYSAVHHHHHPVGPSSTSNFYNAYLSPPGSSVNPPQIYQGGPQFVDGFGGAYKIKSAEGYLGNYQFCNSVAGPSSAVPLTMEVGSYRSMVHNPPPNHLIQGNYQGQVLVPANAPWLDQRFSANAGNGAANWPWGQAPAGPYIQGAGNMVPELVHRSSTNFQPYPPPPPSVYPPPAQGLPQPPPLHHQPQAVQGPFYSQLPGPSSSYNRPPRNSSSNPFQVGMEVAPGFVGPAPPAGLGIFHPPHGRALMPGVTIRHHALPHLNFLPADEVAMLEFSGIHEMGNAIDRHRDMRMDVDSMSYEELLALEERMGYVGTGLSENKISSNLKTRTHISSASPADLHDCETDFCTICQTNYENEEKIGILDCGHEYHVDCVKRWLVLKNICPICKSSALTMKRKESTREG